MHSKLDHRDGPHHQTAQEPLCLRVDGTPLENKLKELFSVVEFIDGRRLGPAFRFLHEHRMEDDKGRLIG
jgi:hypothetical protein